jgi:4-oxalocrotonate tautomerase
MPIVTVEGPKTDIDTKRVLVKKLTDVMVETFPKIGREHFIVLYRENAGENVASGGELLVDMKD